MRKISLLLILLTSNVLWSIELKYKWDEDYRIESTVLQNVKVNDDIILSSIIENRYIVKVLENYDNSADLYVTQSVFQDSAGLTTGYYINLERISGEINQDQSGFIEPITKESFPSVQNVPSFPKEDIKVGDSWTSIGVEHFDLNNSFKIDDVIKTQFRVFYTYMENKTIDNRKLAVIKISYNIYEKVTPYLDWGDFFPEKISGSSQQVLYWDVAKGRPYKVEDDYKLQFFISSGDVYTFVGGTKSRSWPKNSLDSKGFKTLVEELNKTPNTVVEENEDQLKITFKSLLFGPESWLLKENVKSYLNSIGAQLKQYEDINIKIGGHTALLANTDPEYVKELSLKRSHAVAEYLVKMRFIDKRNIEIVGYGGDVPVDTNTTSEGRQNNRRVEIDILKN